MSGCGGAPGPKAQALLQLKPPAMDFAQIATGMGVPARRATTAEEFSGVWPRRSRNRARTSSTPSSSRLRLRRWHFWLPNQWPRPQAGLGSSRTRWTPSIGAPCPIEDRVTVSRWAWLSSVRIARIAARATEPGSSLGASDAPPPADENTASRRSCRRVHPLRTRLLGVVVRGVDDPVHRRDPSCAGHVDDPRLGATGRSIRHCRLARMYGALQIREYGRLITQVVKPAPTPDYRAREGFRWVAISLRTSETSCLQRNDPGRWRVGGATSLTVGFGGQASPLQGS